MLLSGNENLLIAELFSVRSHNKIVLSRGKKYGILSCFLNVSVLTPGLGLNRKHFIAVIVYGHCYGSLGLADKGNHTLIRLS